MGVRGDDSRRREAASPPSGALIRRARLLGMSVARRFELRLIGWGFLLNFIWELAQSPLYEDHVNGWRYVAWTRFHCTVGDVLILLGAFWATAAVFRSWGWPATRGAAAAGAFLGFGLAYTAWSEWFNVGVREAWAYAPSMPLVFGMGLSPLLQWLVLPTLLILILRAGTSRSNGEDG